MIKPITEFKNYFYRENKLFGFDEQGMKEIEIIDEDGDEVKLVDFFVSAGSLYFTTEEMEEIELEGEVAFEHVSKYYMQSSGVMAIKANATTKPTLTRSTFSCPEFSISDFDYQGTPCTDVLNLTPLPETGIERFLMIDGFSYFETVGLYFHVKEGRPKARKDGLYFWKINGTRPDRISDVGEMW